MSVKTPGIPHSDEPREILKWRNEMLRYVKGLTGSLLWNPASLNDGAGETSSAITIDGALLGDFVLVSAPYDLQGITATGYVDADGSVKIRIQNESGGVVNLAEGTWKVKVLS